MLLATEANEGEHHLLRIYLITLEPSRLSGIALAILASHSCTRQRRIGDNVARVNILLFHECICIDHIVVHTILICTFTMRTCSAHITNANGVSLFFTPQREKKERRRQVSLQQLIILLLWIEHIGTITTELHPRPILHFFRTDDVCATVLSLSSSIPHLAP